MIVVQDNQLVPVKVIATNNHLTLAQFMNLALPVQMKLIQEYYKNA